MLVAPAFNFNDGTYPAPRYGEASGRLSEAWTARAMDPSDRFGADVGRADGPIRRRETGGFAAFDEFDVFPRTANLRRRCDNYFCY
jgi:hypothetical protein